MFGARKRRELSFIIINYSLVTDCLDIRSLYNETMMERRRQNGNERNSFKDGWLA